MVFRIFTLLLIILLAGPVNGADTARPFAGIDLVSGQEIKLEDYRGRVVLLDFWASWCPPCLESLPAYERLKQTIGSDRFEVIAVNVDANTADGLAFLERQAVSYPVLADPKGEIGIPYNVRTLPRSFLIDQEGNIVNIYKRFKKDYEKIIEKDIRVLLEPPP